MPVEKSVLPEPLADPLRGLRKALRWIIWLPIVSVVFSLYNADFCSAFTSLLGVIWLSGISHLLPDRPTDIIYLRSFRTDSTTGGIRTSLERVLDPQFRVSGIREPKRRWPGTVRFISYVLFALKYANPKYLNLEAGDEWKARLWRSLGDAKGVVIDIADLTPAVEAEIRLCAKCMGLERILFVVRDTANPDVWRDRILKVLNGSERAVDIEIAVWNPGRASQREFENRIEKFGRELPPKSAGFKSEARALAEQIPGEAFQESSRLLGIEIAVGTALGVLGTTALIMLGRAEFKFFLLLVPCYLGSFVLIAITYVSFRRNCGSRRRQRIAQLTAFPLLISLPLCAMFTVLLVPAVEKIKLASARLQSMNNLKQLVLAMHSYNAQHSHLPGANEPMSASLEPAKPFQTLGKERLLLDSGKKYPVSWRVLVLPFLMDEKGVYHLKGLHQQYRFDEPWDGPNNVQLLQKMPKEFRHPIAKSGQFSAGYTHYRVFASRPGTVPSAIFIDGEPGPRFTSILDGTSKTVMIVEAEEAVPWTMPEFLLFDSNQPLPRLGNFFADESPASLADGAVKTFPRNFPESYWKAWISKNGGEVVIDPEMWNFDRNKERR